MNARTAQKRTSGQGEVDKNERPRSYCEEEHHSWKESDSRMYARQYRRRGRQRRQWTDDISEWTGMAVNDATMWPKSEFNGEDFCVPTTLCMEDGSRRRRRSSEEILKIGQKNLAAYFLDRSVYTLFRII